MGDIANALETLRDARDERGRFVPGTRAALKHGLRMTLDEAPELAAAHRDLVSDISEELGGNLSTLKGRAVHETARLVLLVDALGNNLLAHGPLTGKGRTRAALQAYVMVLDRLQRSMAVLGLERAPEPGTTIKAWVSQKAASP